MKMPAFVEVGYVSIPFDVTSEIRAHDLRDSKKQMAEVRELGSRAWFSYNTVYDTNTHS
jgi:hypothetical protein